jgi:hypothetical protein
VKQEDIMDQKEKQEIGIKIRNASLVSIGLCVALIFITLKAQSNGYLLMAYIAVVTSNVITIVYLFGLRHYINLLYKPKKQKKKDK